MAVSVRAVTDVRELRGFCLDVFVATQLGRCANELSFEALAVHALMQFRFVHARCVDQGCQRRVRKQVAAVWLFDDPHTAEDDLYEEHDPEEPEGAKLVAPGFSSAVCRS